MARAVLQTPFWFIDYAFRPEATTLNPEILNWADERACQNLATPFGPSCLFVTIFSDQTERMSEAKLLADVQKASIARVFLLLFYQLLAGYNQYFTNVKRISDFWCVS